LGNINPFIFGSNGIQFRHHIGGLHFGQYCSLPSLTELEGLSLLIPLHLIVDAFSIVFDNSTLSTNKIFPQNILISLTEYGKPLPHFSLSCIEKHDPLFP